MLANLAPVTYTDEQANVIRSNAASLVVNAFAGTGKTTTLLGYALARPEQRILYLAFNKVTAAEAAGIFPPNVECRTIHSMAYSKYGSRFKHKIGALRPNDIVALYRDVSLLAASYLVTTLEAFMYSADEGIGFIHTPQELPKSDRQGLAGAASRLWVDMIDPAKLTALPHDGYLKLYQLSAPVLTDRFDTILLDEGQDTNPVTASIVFRQASRKVIVGDIHQSIYAFRGSVNAMEMLPDAESHYLTRSMRFGELIATMASHLLRYFKGETQAIIGLGQMAIPADCVDRSKPYAIISRTNAKVFGNAVKALGKQKVHFVGGAQTYLFAKLGDIYSLLANAPNSVQDPFYRSFEDIEALAKYGRETGDMETLSLVSIVREYKHAIPRLIEEVMAQACANASEAEILLVTAHRAKGLQFDQVVLDDDFTDLVDRRGRSKHDGTPQFEQEVNLLYVAMTRAKKAVEFNRQIMAFVQAVKDGVLKPVALRRTSSMPPKPPINPEIEDVVQEGKIQDGSVHNVPDEELVKRIERAILREGLLTAAAISVSIRQSEDVVTSKIVDLIQAGEIASSLFASDRNVQDRLDQTEFKGLSNPSESTFF
jgi:hypothetical protein